MILAAIVLLVSIGGGLLRGRMVFGLEVLSLSQGDVASFVAGLGMWGALGSMLLMVLHSFMPVPAEVIAVANGLCFGPVWGATVTWSGAMIGAVAAFALARRLGRPFLCRIVPTSRRATLEQAVTRAGTLLLLRLIPVVSFNLVNYAAGLAGAGWWTFLWTTALGILPLTILTAVLGARMFDITWPVWAAIGAAVAVLWFAGRGLRRRWGDR